MDEKTKEKKEKKEKEENKEVKVLLPTQIATISRFPIAGPSAIEEGMRIVRQSGRIKGRVL